MKKIFYCMVLIIFSCVCYSNQAFAQSIVKKSAKQICKCLNEKAENDTLNLTPKQIFDRCTGETMGGNREELAKEFDIGSVQGILQLRDKFVELLNKDCDKFNEMFMGSSDKRE